MLLAARVLPAGAPRVPVHGPQYRPAYGIGVMLVVAGLPLVIAALAREPGFRLFMLAMGLLILAAVPVAVVWTRSLSAGRVRVDAVGGLRFAPPAWLGVALLALAVAGVLVGALPYVLAAEGIPALMGSGVRRYSPGVLALLSLGWLGYQLAGWREPRGLTLSPEGLRGVRGADRVRLAWDDLDRVEVAPGWSARLILHTVAGSAHAITAQWMGSDPNLVAAIVEHFRAHPEDRPALVDGPAAIGIVERAVPR